MNVFTHLGALVLVSEDLSLRLGRGTECRHFVFNTELIAIIDLISVKVLVGSAMVQKDRLPSTDYFTLTVLKVSVTGLDDPHGVVNFLVDQRHLLVAGETGKSKGSDWDRVEVQGFVHDLCVGSDAYFLPEMHAIIRRPVLSITSLDNEYAPSDRTHCFGSSSDTVSLVT